MKLLLWNYRGWGRPDLALQFNFLCCLCYLDVFCIVEPRSSLDRGSQILCSLVGMVGLNASASVGMIAIYPKCDCSEFSFYPLGYLR